MTRLVKRTFSRLLPGAVRRAIKERLENATAGPVGSGRTFALEEVSPTVCRCVVDGRWSFLSPAACEGDLRDFITDPRRQTEFNVLADAAESGGIVFDIGAHAGLTGAIFCAGNPGNRVFGFEPSPMLQKRLEEMAALNEFGERFQIERVGIGNAPGTMKMLIDPTGGFVQSQHFENSMWGQPAAIEVPLETIAGAAARLGVIPDVIKVDIEGFEYEALRGSADFLRQHRPKILLELHLNYLEQRKLSARALVETLAGCGYAFRSYAGHALRPGAVYGSPLAILHVIAERA